MSDADVMSKPISAVVIRRLSPFTFSCASPSQFSYPRVSAFPSRSLTSFSCAFVRPLSVPSRFLFPLSSASSLSFSCSRAPATLRLAFWPSSSLE